MIVISLVVVFVCAALTALAVTPWTRRIAQQLGALDRPDGGRKMHRGGVALGGGFVVLFSSLAALGLGQLLNLYRSDVFFEFDSNFVWLLAPGVLVLLLVALTANFGSGVLCNTRSIIRPA